ncbi:MAG: hypothetical protein KAQ85_01435 [Thermodesulfovibrionia bacterium]|nr:hypothetical protein [Thermodesulfovibrionia bacterium]
MKVLLIGDEIQDIYLHTVPVKLSEEAPVVIVRQESKSSKAGGAANVVSNLEGLGMKVDFYYGEKTPSVKNRIITNNRQMIRIDEDNLEVVKPSKKLERLIAVADIVVISDYDKGVVTDEMIEMIDSFNVNVIVDPYKLKYNYGKNVLLIKPNRKEVESVTGMRIDSRDTLVKAAHSYMELSGAENLVITLDIEGMVLFDRATYYERPYIHGGKAEALIDITGAGDTVFAVLIYIWTQAHFSKSTAVRYANKAGGIAVKHPGNYVAKHSEVFESE